MVTNQIVLPSEGLLRQLCITSSYGDNLDTSFVTDDLLKCVLNDLHTYETMLYCFEIPKGYTYRIKSSDSIFKKIERHPYANAQLLFNDLVGLRTVVKQYPTEYPDYFEVKDMRYGKLIDDGYRAVHLYYKKDNISYPVEVQLWSEQDAIYNNWMRRYGYKTVPSDELYCVYCMYKEGDISTFEEYRKAIGTI